MCRCKKFCRDLKDGFGVIWAEEVDSNGKKCMNGFRQQVGYG